MKENQNDQRNQDKTGNQSTQKHTQDNSKKGVNQITTPSKQQGARPQDQQEQDKKRPTTQDSGKKA